MTCCSTRSRVDERFSWLFLPLFACYLSLLMLTSRLMWLWNSTNSFLVPYLALKSSRLSFYGPHGKPLFQLMWLYRRDIFFGKIIFTDGLIASSSVHTCVYVCDDSFEEKSSLFSVGEVLLRGELLLSFYLHKNWSMPSLSVAAPISIFNFNIHFFYFTWK